MTTDGKYSCSWLKMPSMGFYIGTLTAIHSVIYCLFSILSFAGLFKEEFLLSIAILVAVSLPFFTFFCNISMLFFGKEYRKNNKSSYWDWTSLCYSLMILFDIAMLVMAFLTRTGNAAFFIENHSMIFNAFMINALIPFFFVPLPAALCCGSRKRLIVAIGLLCHVIGLLLLWIAFMIVMVNACDDRSVAATLFNMFPYKMFHNVKIHGFFTLIIILAVLLTAAGYLSHLCIVAAINGIAFKCIFSKCVVFLICAPIAVHVGSFFCSRASKISYEIILPNLFKVPLTVEGLETLYYNGESPDDAFWNEFNSKVAPREEAGMRSISEMIDKVEKIPKCRRNMSLYIEGGLNDLESVSAYCVYLKYSMQKVFKANDSAEAMRIARRALKVDAFLLGDFYASAGLWHVFICNDILKPFSKSKIVSSDDLQEIKAALAESEKKIDDFYYNVNFWHTFCLSTLWENRQNEDRIDVGNGNSMPVPSLHELFFIFPQQYIGECKNHARQISKDAGGDNPVLRKMRGEAFEACRILNSN